MGQYGFYFDSAKCTGCKTCQVACKENHHLPAHNLFRRVYHYAGGSWEPTEAGFYAPVDTFSYQVSVSCNHCANPACVAACPTGAMQKDPETGIVTTDHELCVGCQACVEACPYQAPSLDEESGYVIKCDFCREEIGTGNTPFCVAACPMRALDWGEYDDLVARYGEGNVNVEPLPMDTTGPCLVLNPHPKAQASGNGTGAMATLDEELF